MFQIFNLFDEDGNGNISIEELLNLMAFFIEIGEGKEHKVSMFFLYRLSWIQINNRKVYT
jgi:Ca2+-binding EF-hand superfamily protein